MSAAWFLCVMFCVPLASQAGEVSKDIRFAADQQIPAAGDTGLFVADSALGLYYTRNSVCGVAATYYALSEIGRKTSLVELARDLEVTPRGSSVEQISRTLSQLGVSHCVFKTDSLDLIARYVSSRRRVAILHLDRPAHFVTLTRTAKGDLVFLDGPEVLRGDMGKPLSARFSGIAIILGERIPGCVVRALSGRMAIVLAVTALAGLAWGAWIRKHRNDLDES